VSPGSLVIVCGASLMSIHTMTDPALIVTDAG